MTLGWRGRRGLLENRTLQRTSTAEKAQCKQCRLTFADAQLNIAAVAVLLSTSANSNAFCPFYNTIEERHD